MSGTERFSYRKGGQEAILSHQEKRERYGPYSPITVLIENSRICNCACMGCGIDTRPPHLSDNIPTLSDSEITQALDHSREAGILGYWLSGGEIFRRPELIYSVISRFKNTGFDIQKINTNLLPFTSPQAAETIFKQLKEAGLADTKTFIPLIAGGLGYQQTHVPLENAVHFTDGFHKVFSPEEARCSLTITGNSVMREKLALKFKSLFKSLTSKDFPEDEIPLDLFGYMWRGRALDIKPSLIDLYKLSESLFNYNCFRYFFDGIVNPRPVLVVDSCGNISPCPDFNNDPLVRVGNIRDVTSKGTNPIIEAIKKVNENPYLMMVAEGGNEALYQEVEKRLTQSSVEALDQLLISSRHDSCRLFMHLLNDLPPDTKSDLNTDDFTTILFDVLKGDQNVIRE